MDNKQYKEALNLFDKQSKSPRDVIIYMGIKACIHLKEYQRIIEIEQKLSPAALNNPYIQTILIQFYMQNHDIKNAYRLFSIINNKSNHMYATMFKGLISNKMPEKVLDLYEKMNIKANPATLTTLFSACSKVENDRARNIGKGSLYKMPNNYYNNNILLTSAINMLMKFNDIQNAENLFKMIKNKDIITYGSMMKGYSENKEYDKVLDLFEQMSLKPDRVIAVLVFNASAQLMNDRAKQIGRQLLYQMPKHFHSDTVVLTSVIDMLMKFNDVTTAEHYFKMIKKKDIVTYSVLMNGYNINHEPLKCLQLLDEIKQHNLIPDEVVWIILIGACAQLSMLSKCQLIFDQIPSHLFNKKYIQNSLIHMWGKAGSVENAQKIFQLVDNPNAITYSAMINAYGLNRMGLEAIELYRNIPCHLRDEVTYICVLNACSHSALLDDAYSIFNEIPQKNEQIITTMIDCVSRLYLFDEAQKLIEDYEKLNPPSSAMYMTILSGTRNSRQHILSKQIYDRMKILFPNQKDSLISGSILLSNIYLSLGDYQEAENIRLNRIKQLGTKVKSGTSWTEVNGDIVEFKANDHSHPQYKQIYAQSKHISDTLIKYDPSWISCPLRKDETIESFLSSHSERLAIAYHFIQQKEPSFIQITNNLRMCGDCHRATKLISKIWQCEIIVRDTNCIHHFSSDGTCSCQDHF
ncbi:unnamed protein product [Adineta steineri]|uniref:DYW domain-containing protein n=2 Tax=Adineta steineri TaxID=433720 RepID=A0A814G4E1_9BILA|nr:unnamed protein product [Adineta steineri]